MKINNIKTPYFGYIHPVKKANIAPYLLLTEQ